MGLSALRNGTQCFEKKGLGNGMWIIEIIPRARS